MDRRCRSCKWWWTTRRGDAKWGECQLTRRDAGIPAHHESRALANGTSLATQADFGCVQWEPVERDGD